MIFLHLIHTYWCGSRWSRSIFKLGNGSVCRSWSSRAQVEQKHFQTGKWECMQELEQPWAGGAENFKTWKFVCEQELEQRVCVCHTIFWVFQKNTLHFRKLCHHNTETKMSVVVVKKKRLYGCLSDDFCGFWEKRDHFQKKLFIHENSLEIPYQQKLSEFWLRTQFLFRTRFSKSKKKCKKHRKMSLFLRRISDILNS